MFRHLYNPERSLIVIFLLTLVGALVYFNSFGVGFQLDDMSVIVRNFHLRHPEKITELFRYDPTRFLTHQTFAFNVIFHGFKPAYFHLVNLLIHIGCAITVYFLTAKTLVLAKVKDIKDEETICLVSFFCALVFLTHPVQTESVTYIVQRSTALAAFFYLISLMMYLKLKEYFRWTLYVVALGVIALGTMTKPIFITLPLMILLYEFCFFDLWGRIQKKEIRFKQIVLSLPYCSVVVVIPLFLMLFSLHYTSEAFDSTKLIYATRVTSEISRWEYLLTQSRVLLTYIGLLLFPINQNLDYDFPLSRQLFEPQTLLPCLSIVGILWVALRLWRDRRIFAFGIFWFFIALIPESSVFPIPDVIFEHRLYLALAGFSVIVSVGLYFLLKEPRRYFMYGILIITSLSFVTYSRNEIWRYPLILWKDVVKKSPLKARPNHILADAYFALRLLDSAEAQYKKTISLDVNYLQSYNNLGRLYVLQKKDSAAEALFKHVLERELGNFEANVNLGNIYFQRGQWDLAVAQFKMAATIMPNAETPYLNLGNIYARMKSIPQALEFYEKAIKHNPYNAFVHYALGNLYMEEKDFPSAISNYKKAILLNPLYPDVYNTLGIAYAASENLSDAEICFQKAIKLKPDFTMAYLNAANISRAKGDIEQAQRYSHIATELRRRQGAK